MASKSWRSSEAALLLVAALCAPIAALAEPAGKPSLFKSIQGKVTIRSAAGEPVEDLSNVVVYLEDVPTGPPTEAYSRFPAPSLSSRAKRFEPPVLPVVVGTEVEFPNEDDIMHNVFSVSPVKKFDLGLYVKGKKKTVTFDRLGVVPVYCNIHERMVSYVVVLRNPYYSVTREDGSFRIPAVPDGDYKLVAWQRYGDGAEARVLIDGTVEQGGSRTVELSLTEKTRGVRHKNKFGNDYKGKY